MDFVSLQGVKPRFAIARAEAFGCAAPAPTAQRAGLQVQNAFISVTAFCIVGRYRKQRSKALFIFLPRRISQFMRPMA